MTFTTTQWILVGLAAILVGFTKTGVPGMGILVVPLMALVLPAKESVGALLPMLVVGDFMAVALYRRHAQWGKLWGLFPSVAVGIAVATWLLGRVDNAQMKPLLGWLVLILIGLEFLRQWAGWHNVPHHPAFVIAMGFFGGFGTTMGNVAGPIMTIYFLARGLERDHFIGTFAWFFLIVNLTKVPIYISMGMITTSALWLTLVLLPLIAVGAVLGGWVLRRIPIHAFSWVVLVLAAITAIRLVWP